MMAPPPFPSPPPLDSSTPLSPLCWIPDPFTSPPPPSPSHQCTRCGSSTVDACPVRCPLGCGAGYCSETCRERALGGGGAEGGEGHHGRLCVGPHDEHHPLYRYKVLALASGRADVYAVLMLALELVLCRPGGTSMSLLCEIRTKYIPGGGAESYVGYDECIRGQYRDGEGEGSDDAPMESIARDSHGLLLEILSERTGGGTAAAPDDDAGSPGDDVVDGADDSATPSLAVWDALLSYVNRNRVTLDVPSAHAVWCRRITDADGWDDDDDDCCALIREAKHNLSAMEEGELEGDAGTDDDEEEADKEDSTLGESDGDDSSSGFDGATAVVDAVHLMDEPDFYFPPHRCTALFPRVFKHSCLPTHSLRYVGRGTGDATSSTTDGLTVGMKGRALHASLHRIEECEGGLRFVWHNVEGDAKIDETDVTISLIDNTLDLEGRVEQLSLRGMGGCDCVRCAFERYGDSEDLSWWQEETGHCEEEGDDSTSCTALLRRLLSQAKFDQRHDDTLRVCEAMLRRNPADPEALVDRARIAGWAGDFGRRERLLEQAASIASNDGRIGALLDETRAYYRDGDWGRKNNTIASNAAAQSCHYEAIAGLGGRAFVAEYILDAEESAAMVSYVEEHQKSTAVGGWTTSRHYAVPTTDVPIYQVPKVLAWFNDKLEHIIFPMLRGQFSIEVGKRLRIFDAFFVKYHANAGQRRLPLHNDQSTHSLTIAMNPADRFSGRGTYFAATGETIKTDVGGVVSFEGDLIHAGRNIDKGVRYIIACFLYVEEQGDA